VSLDNLMTFSFIKEAVAEDRLRLFGWYFDIENGELLQYDPEMGYFHDLYFDWQ
jgi:carbonic anhydrase